MSNQAENNQEVQTIELTVEQVRAISSARSYLNFYLHDLTADIKGWKEKGLDCSELEENCKEFRKDLAVIDGILVQSTFPSTLS